jgi:1-pyrroline-5-carboxylate dehydrogenase
MDGYDRAAIFMRAADLLAGPRRIQNIAAIMLNQSKTPFEAEIDLAELVDFWRFNAYYMQFLYEQQPDQISGEINRFDWRPLEGFVLAVPPFNFYSIGAISLQRQLWWATLPSGSLHDRCCSRIIASCKY